ncbi:hypothetical protein BRD00_12635 [Halobacteriales archaeon QS_8_69_26]|nr:MAG: hypothetical protein BRD00_12635 [Halobacteriales archaeon QS_8_69_26]
MSVQLEEVGVTADLTLLVTRDDQGTLEGGALDRVTAVDAVTDVEHVDVTGVRPRLNDLAVEAAVDLTVAVDPTARDAESAAVEALEEGFGVTVEALAVSANA